MCILGGRNEANPLFFFDECENLHTWVGDRTSLINQLSHCVAVESGPDDGRVIVKRLGRRINI